MYSKNNWNSRLAGDGVAVSYKGKHNRTIYSSIPLLGFYLQEMKIFVHKKDFYLNVHKSFNYNKPKPEMSNR